MRGYSIDDYRIDVEKVYGQLGTLPMINGISRGGSVTKKHKETLDVPADDNVIMTVCFLSGLLSN
jgi:hypothetical protein